MTRLEFIKSKFEEIEQVMDKMEKLFKLFRANGFLGSIPLLVTSTNYSQDNEVTGYKSYLKESFNENMYINPYSLQVTAWVYGKKWVEELEKLIKESKERKYTIFLYTKMNNKAYAPVAISNLTYEEDYNSYSGILVSFTLKEVNLLQFTTKDGTTATNTYDPSTDTQNRELLEVVLTENISEIFFSDSRTEGVR